MQITKNNRAIRFVIQTTWLRGLLLLPDYLTLSYFCRGFSYLRIHYPLHPHFRNFFFSHFILLSMLHTDILDQLNKQMNKEFFSAYLYLSVSSYFNSLNLDGFEQWTKLQAQEELMHGMKIYSYLLERQAKVALHDIPAPAFTWLNPADAVQAIYNHECSLTVNIHAILKTAREHNDYPTEVFLHWFITEQIEEETMADKVLQKLHLIGDNGGALLMLDDQLLKVSPQKPEKQGQ